MKTKRFHKGIVVLSLIMALMMSLGGMNVYAAGATRNAAIEYVEVADTSDDEIMYSLSRATQSINWTISANSTSTGSTTMPMAIGETIRINITYSPTGADLDVGILQPDGSFRYVKGSNGSVDHTFTINSNGSYQVRIRNNSSNSVTVLGFVYY